MTNDELAQKFRANAQGVLSTAHIDSLIDAVMNLEKVDNFAAVMAMSGRSVARA
jgi:hypothetical protein